MQRLYVTRIDIYYDVMCKDYTVGTGVRFHSGKFLLKEVKDFRRVKNMLKKQYGIELPNKEELQFKGVSHFGRYYDIYYAEYNIPYGMYIEVSEDLDDY